METAWGRSNADKTFPRSALRQPVVDPVGASGEGASAVFPVTPPPYEPDSPAERRMTHLREADALWEDVHGYMTKKGKRVRSYTRFEAPRNLNTGVRVIDLTREPNLSPREVAVLETAIRVPPMSPEERMARARRLD